MKLLLLFLALMAGSVAVVFAQDGPTARDVSASSKVYNVYYAPVKAYRVKIESAKGMVSVLDVPEGVFLNIQVDTEQNPGVEEEHGFPRTFRGDLVVRARRADELEASESRDAEEIMAKAPLEMVIQNGMVVVEIPKARDGG